MLIGCNQKPATSTAVTSPVAIQTSSGAVLSFSSAQEGSVTATGNRIEVVQERKFTIDGVIEGEFDVGDFVFIDLCRRLKDGKLSTCANAVAKVATVSDGKATFHTDFYVTKYPQQDCTLRIEAKLEKKPERSMLAEVDVRIRPPQ